MEKIIISITALLLLTVKVFGQDILVKKDSSKIEAKLLEIRPTEIKYKYFNYQEGPTLIINKNEVAYIVYANGQTEIFSLIPEQPKIEQANSYINSYLIEKNHKDSLRKRSRVGDYIKFNIQAGIVINNSYSNLQRRQNESSQTTRTEYSRTNKSDYNYNVNIGVNFLFGKNDYIKHVIGINYLRSKGEFNYNYSFGGYTSYKTDFRYTSKIDFINFVTGLRFAIGKHLFIEPLASFNLIAKADVRYSGTQTTTHITGGPSPYISSTEIEYFDNVKTEAERKEIVHTVSLCPRVSYEFKVKQQTLGVYASYNIAYRFRLPWYMVGVTYYPFKKLR